MSVLSVPSPRAGGAVPQVWLVTGGAGYIGAHVVRALRAEGHEVVVVDDLTSGTRSAVPADVTLVEANVRETSRLQAVMRAFGVTGVMHLAARKSVPESVADPMTYYRENVDGTLSVVEAMLSVGVGTIVLASSAAVYGDVSAELVSESAPTVPVSPYGESKLISEWIVRDFAHAHGLTAAILRYFNVAGTASCELADLNGAGLVPAMVAAVGSGRRPVVFGTDYPTKDGSCVRDYVHVLDLAQAHVDVARQIGSWTGATVLNLGSGRGTSVLDVVDAVATAATADSGTAGEITALHGEPRPGDIATSVADVAAITSRLGWRPRLGIDAMVTSQWQAWTAAHEAAPQPAPQVAPQPAHQPAHQLAALTRLMRHPAVAAALLVVLILGLGTFGTQYAVAKGLGVQRVDRSPDAYVVVHPDPATRFDPATIRLLVASGASVAVDQALVAQQPDALKRLAAAGVPLVNAGSGPPYTTTLVHRPSAIDTNADKIGQMTGRAARFYLAGRAINALDLALIRSQHEKIIQADFVATSPTSVRVHPGRITLLECAAANGCNLDQLLTTSVDEAAAGGFALSSLAAANA